MQIIGATCNVLIRLWFRSLPLWANQNTTLCEGPCRYNSHIGHGYLKIESTHFEYAIQRCSYLRCASRELYNITYPGQLITTEIIDLDAAGFAPWLLDVRRALTAQRIFAGSMTGCETMCQDAVVVGWLEGFEQGFSIQILIVQSKIVEDLMMRLRRRQ